MLLDFKCQRRKSAFDLLEGIALDEIMRRLQEVSEKVKRSCHAINKIFNLTFLTYKLIIIN